MIAATGLVGDKIQINDPFYRDRTTLDAYKGKVRSSSFEPSEGPQRGRHHRLCRRPCASPSGRKAIEVGTLNTGMLRDAAKAAKNGSGASYSTRKAWRDPTCIQKAPTSEEGTNQIVLPGRREDYKIEVLDTAGGATNVAIHTYDKNGQPTVRAVLENAGAVVANLNFDPEKPAEVKVVEGQKPTAAGSADASPSAAASPSPSATSTPVPARLARRDEHDRLRPGRRHPHRDREQPWLRARRHHPPEPGRGERGRQRPSAGSGRSCSGRAAQARHCRRG
ncbi:MAG: hypothetical protein U0547_06045 [Dehalococcoidia bacterium]